MALPIAAGMFFQTLYFLIDLYFVAGLGDAAIAGVGAAGNVIFMVFALTQVLGVGTVTLISHAAGRKDQADANLVFNQSLALSACCARYSHCYWACCRTLLCERLGVRVRRRCLPESNILYWYVPNLALQFAVVSMGSALRGTGIVRPTMVVQMLAVILNAVLAPVLIAGWGTGHPMGVAGAGLASSIAMASASSCWLVFPSTGEVRRIRCVLWRPQMAVWQPAAAHWTARRAVSSCSCSY